MNEIKVLGIDLGEDICSVVGLDDTIRPAAVRNGAGSHV
jgi:hypothetical protein